MLPLDERSCRSARGRSAKVRKITDSTYCTAFYGLGLNSERQIAMYAFLALCFMAGMLSDRLIDRPIAKRVMRRLSGAR